MKKTGLKKIPIAIKKKAITLPQTTLVQMESQFVEEPMIPTAKPTGLLLEELKDKGVVQVKPLFGGR